VGDRVCAGGEQGKGDPAADRPPGAHLVLVKSEAALGVLERGLDRPTESGDADQPAGSSRLRAGR
jgi:hypothetical protein